MKKYEAPICDLLVWRASDILMDSANGLVPDNLDPSGLEKDTLEVQNIPTLQI